MVRDTTRLDRPEFGSTTGREPALDGRSLLRIRVELGRGVGFRWRFWKRFVQRSKASPPNVRMDVLSYELCICVMKILCMSTRAVWDVRVRGYGDCYSMHLVVTSRCIFLSSCHKRRSCQKAEACFPADGTDDNPSPVPRAHDSSIPRKHVRCCSIPYLLVCVLSSGIHTTSFLIASCLCPSYSIKHHRTHHYPGCKSLLWASV